MAQLPPNLVRKRKLFEFAAERAVRSFNTYDFSRCIKILLYGTDEELKKFIVEMNGVIDTIDSEISRKIVYVCEYVIYYHLMYRDELEPVELIYFMCRQLHKNLSLIAEDPTKGVEEQLLNDALDRYNLRLGELRRKPKREVVEYINTDVSDFDFYYMD